MPGGDLHREEVRGGQDLPVQREELRLAHARLPALRGGLQVVTAEDVPHRDRVNMMPQVRERPLDASIAPGRILFGHAHHELLHLLVDPGSATLTTLRTPVKLLGDQSLVPAQERVRRGNRGHFFEARATDRMCERCEAPAVGVRQAEPAATKLGFQDAVFLVQVGDNLLLVTLEPASDHGDQDVEDHGRSSGWRHDEMVRSSLHPTCATSMR
jgi:hypothetical protein